MLPPRNLRPPTSCTIHFERELMVTRLATLPIIAAILLASPARAASPKEAEIDGLRKAYLNLVAGNHDYKGHRAKALKQVEAAAQALGLNIAGDGKARQQQKNSDTNLSAAKAALEPVLELAKSQGQPQLEKHVTAAIKEIDTALKIK